MTTLRYPDFRGPAKRIEDIDLPRIGAEIGVGEDELHAFMDVETTGSGFDSQGRPKMLFEPHKFYANLGAGTKRDKAVKAGLAYARWGEKPYPKDSYPVLAKAMAIDETAALKSASWGLGQVMGENFADGGYASVQDMVNAMCEDEDKHLEMMVGFIKANAIDDDLRRLAALTRPTTPADCAPIVRVYNGSGYAKNKYDVKFAAAHNKWRGIKDTPWAPEPIDTSVIVTPVIPAPVIVPPTAEEHAALPVDIKDLQQALKDKGYVEVGKVDGMVGKNTLAAIAAFQIAQGMPVDGAVTPELLAAIKAAPMRPVSVERANATADTLVKDGQPLIKPALLMRNLGAAVTGTMGVGAVLDGGPVDLDHVMTSATKLHALWTMLGNLAPWLIGGAIGIAVLYFGSQMITRQIAEYRKGTLR